MSPFVVLPTCSSHEKKPAKLLENEILDTNPTKPMLNLPVSEPCMQEAISFKEEKWSSHVLEMSFRRTKFDEAMSCIQKAYKELLLSKMTQ